MFDSILSFVSRLFSSGLIKKFPEIDRGNQDNGTISGCAFAFFAFFMFIFYFILTMETSDLCLIFAFMIACSLFLTIPFTAITMRLVYGGRARRIISERGRQYADQQLVERVVIAPKLAQIEAPRPRSPEQVQALESLHPEPVKEPDADEYAVVGSREIEHASEVKQDGQIRLKKRRCPICGTPISKDDLTCPNAKNH